MNTSSFTQMPNKFLDDKNLNPYQYMILAFIVRKTDGWCKTEDGISLSQFVDTLNISKNKVISTLKELKEMGYIEVKQQFLKNGGKSFNSYSISSTLVHEVNYPSASQGQGVVHEKDIQKKLLTKETNTIIKNKQKNLSFETQTKIKVQEAEGLINKTAIREWLEYKNYKRIAPITKTINFLSKFDFATQQQIVDNSIMNGYKGLFEPKQQKQQPFNTPKSQTLNTDVNIWDEIEKQSNNNQEFIDG